MVAGAREAPLIQFQATMQRFLEAQESVMLAYLTRRAHAVQRATSSPAGEANSAD